MKILKYFLVALAVIIIDQAFKLWVYNDYITWKDCAYLDCYELKVIGDWFRLHYLLNPGMAFGLKLDSEFGKLALTLFRIIAMFGIGYYLWKVAKQKMHTGFLICLGLILGGAVGNVIDSTFYGVFLNNAPLDAPTPWFHGQVIDMLYFPLIKSNWPSWVPFVGGQEFEFFRPVFNIADSSIFIGVVVILIMQKRFFKDQSETVSTPAEETPVPPSTNTPEHREPVA